MTRSKAKEFVKSLVRLRDVATDNQAIEALAIYPTWKPEISYEIDDRVLYNSVLYKVITSHVSQDAWVPDVSPSLFAKILIPDENVIPEWEQPDSTNAYMTGDRVSHNDKIWTSIVDSNVWEPGSYGWEETV